MAWLSHNFIQSEGSIHATCNNLVCCKTGLNVTWVVKRTTYIFNSFCSNVAKQVLPNTPVSLSRFFLAKNYPVYPQSSQCKNFECNYWLITLLPFFSLMLLFLSLVLLIHTGNTCSCRLSFQKQSTNKNLLFHFRKVCCVVYFIENFVENSLGFCNLFSQCVCTLHNSLHGSYRKNFVVKFPCHRLFSSSLFFLPNWQPLAPSKIKWFSPFRKDL